MLLDKAEECKTANMARYKQTLGRLYGASKPTSPKAFGLLMKLPFRGYITTNYDPLLNEAAASASERKRELQVFPIIYSGNIDSMVNVFYIHGMATATGDNLILARSDFDSAYKQGVGPVHALLFNVLMFKPIVFVGCTLKEPDMKEVFKRVRDIQEEIKTTYPKKQFPQRRALLPFRYEDNENSINPHGHEGQMPKRDEKEENAEYERFSEMGIKIVRYDPHDPPMHMSIQEILEQLCKDADIEVRLKPKVDYGEDLPS